MMIYVLLTLVMVMIFRSSTGVGARHIKNSLSKALGPLSHLTYMKQLESRVILGSLKTVIYKNTPQELQVILEIHLPISSLDLPRVVLLSIRNLPLLLVTMPQIEPLEHNNQLRNPQRRY